MFQAAGGLWKDLQETLCSLPFIYVKFKAGLGSQLLEDFLANGVDFMIIQSTLITYRYTHAYQESYFDLEVTFRAKLRDNYWTG